MAKQLLVFGVPNFKITVPDDAKITFGPFSPPRSRDGGRGGFDNPSDRRGTLRIYQGTKDNILACFAGVDGFRDLSLEYMEEVVREEGATIWKSDEFGYMRENKHQATKDWVEPPVPALPKPKPRRTRKVK